MAVLEYRPRPELEIVGFSWLDVISPRLFVIAIGIAQLGSAVALCLLSGRWLRVLLWCQLAAPVVLPFCVLVPYPANLFHPLQPLGKNLPLIPGQFLLVKARYRERLN